MKVGDVRTGVLYHLANGKGGPAYGFWTYGIGHATAHNAYLVNGFVDKGVLNTRVEFSELEIDGENLWEVVPDGKVEAVLRGVGEMEQEFADWVSLARREFAKGVEKTLREVVRPPNIVKERVMLRGDERIFEPAGSKSTLSKGKKDDSRAKARALSWVAD